MSGDMEFVEDDSGFRRMFSCGIPKSFPHVHDRKLNTFRAFNADLDEELIHVFLRAARAADPDRTLLIQVSHNDPVSIAQCKSSATQQRKKIPLNC